jgi:hypothetical protein
MVLVINRPAGHYLAGRRRNGNHYPQDTLRRRSSPTKITDPSKIIETFTKAHRYGLVTYPCRHHETPSMSMLTCMKPFGN